MEGRITKALDSLGVAEKDVVSRQGIGPKVTLWGRLLDEVRDSLDLVSELPRVQDYFNQANSYFENVITSIENLDVSNGGISDVKSYYDEFSRSHLPNLLNIKQDIQALSTDSTNLATLRKLIKDAKLQQAEFEKSFKTNLEKQASGSQRVLATHFKKRLEELKASDETNPTKWLEKRNWWFVTLLSTIVTFAAVFLFIFNAKWFEGYELQLALMKLAVIAILYLQYHFAAKNYHIYADLLAKYEHLAVISETMTDFTAAAFDNEELNTVVYTNAAKTLFGEVNTGHLKQITQEPSMIENFINQIPKGGQ